MLIKVENLIFLMGFIELDVEGYWGISVILGRPFLQRSNPNRHGEKWADSENGEQARDIQ